MTCRWNNQLVKWSTGLTVVSKDWDQRKKEPKNSDPNHLKIKSKMLQLEKAAQAIYLDYEAQESGIIPQSIFKERLAIATGRKEDTTQADKSLIQFALKFCEGKRVALRQNLDSLIEFAAGKDVQFDDIDHDFIERYTEFLKDKGLAVNTINGKLGSITQFLRAGVQKRLHNNTFRIDRDQKLDAKKKQKPIIALDMDELIRFASLDVSGDLELSRDLFIMGFYSGQRISDFSRITPELIINGELKIYQQKTDSYVEIPINLLDALPLPYTFEYLLKKHNYSAPQIGYTTFLNHIRQLAKMAGITEPVRNIVDKGGERYIPEAKKAVPKYKKVSTHTARKSFATVLYRAGVEIDNLRVFTGHATVEMLMAYIGVGQEERKLNACRDVARKIGSATPIALKKAI